MKTLQPIRNNFSFLGVQSLQKHPFNLKNTLCSLLKKKKFFVNAVNCFYHNLDMKNRKRRKQV